MATKTPSPRGLLTEIQGETRTVSYRCGVARAAERLDAKDAADYWAAINDSDTYTGAAIARAMTNRGHRITQGIIHHHRRGDCNCGK